MTVARSRRFTLIPTLILISFAGSAVFVGIMAAGKVRTALAIRGYEETTGQVTASELRGPREQQLAFAARFEVGGKSYTVNAGNGTPEGLHPRDLVAKYAVGSQVTVFYDPGDPSKATLSRSVPYLKWVAIFAVTLAAAIAVLVFILRRSS